MFDDFRVRGHPSAPHPHAGFSAVTYVFDDSPGRLRSRDSLGNDHVVGRGGIVWTQAEHGVMHEEMLADLGEELHGLQFFVNLTCTTRLSRRKCLHWRAIWCRSGQGPTVTGCMDCARGVLDEIESQTRHRAQIGVAY